jgi:hypothetical protein
MNNSHVIQVKITDVYVEFRNFPVNGPAFDPGDDMMFFPLSIGMDPDAKFMLCPEYILINNQNEEVFPEIGEYYNTFYGVRWSLNNWNPRDGRKLAWLLVEYMKQKFKLYANVVLVK